MMQALAGWMTITGEPGAPPTKSGLSLVDLSGGYVAAIAMLGALWRARRDGVGCDCDVSLFDTALAELCYVGTWVATEGYAPSGAATRRTRRSSRSRTSRRPTAGSSSSCPKEKFWQRLCDAIERPELRDDPAFADFAARVAERRAAARDPRAALPRADDRRVARAARDVSACRARRSTTSPRPSRTLRPSRARASSRSTTRARGRAAGGDASAPERRRGAAPTRPVPRRAHRSGARGAVRLHAGAGAGARRGGRLRRSAIGPDTAVRHDGRAELSPDARSA